MKTGEVKDWRHGHLKLEGMTIFGHRAVLEGYLLFLNMCYLSYKI